HVNLHNGVRRAYAFIHYGRKVESSMAHAARVDVMLMTPEEFLEYPYEDGKAELVRGELCLTPPPGGPHGRAGTNLVVLLAVYLKGRNFGSVFGDGVGYELLALPRTVRVPDASFVRADRLPAEGIGPGLLKLAPDLAIEVLSPSERASALEEKLDDYRWCGTPLIWVVDPVRRTVMIVASDAPVRWLREGDTLDAANIIPGFTCAVEEVFDGIAR
ncbi:MAG: Uma2 family endonuclease, partial [bacterium]